MSVQSHSGDALHGSLVIRQGWSPKLGSRFTLHTHDGSELGYGHVSEHHGHGHFSIDIHLDLGHMKCDIDHGAVVRFDAHVLPGTIGILKIGEDTLDVKLVGGRSDRRSEDAPHVNAGYRHSA